ncbi:MAG: hypothetical protein DMD81_08925 [Candidatus Rokuibacteriota bacterium]|nr:MAG: hypothetical protein DMD81_08925 [Candidatus Rokubacteria bacterium]
MDAGPRDDRRERARHPERHAGPSEQRDEEHDQRHEAHEGIREELQRRQEGDQQDRDAADRAEQRRARNDATHPVARERERDLRDPDHERGRHPDLPREDGVPGRDHHRPEHAEHHREERRRVDSEGHGGHVVAPARALEPHGQPGVREISRERAQRRARHHASEHQVGGELEDADQETGQDDELGRVIEREPQEAVHVPGGDPPGTGPGRVGVARGYRAPDVGCAASGVSRCSRAS